MSLLAAVSLVTACVNSSEEAAQTPSDAPTVANSALQTNSKGETVTAPASAAPASTAPASTAPASTAPAAGGSTTPAAAAGDAAAGETFFAATCTGCHMNNGKDAGGVGPKLAGLGLDATTVKNQVINGGGAMPAGLASGTDLDNVVAYVVSLQ